MVGATLRTPNGVVGYVPLDALDSSRQRVVVEVVIELKERETYSIYLLVNISDLHERLMREDGPGIKGIRTWLIDRARTRFVLAHPDREQDIVAIRRLYWSCGRDHKRAPFLR